VDVNPKSIDNYIADLFLPSHPGDSYKAALEHARDRQLPQIQISTSEGLLLHVLARAVGAMRILEVGTLGGYSGMWLASALPEGGKLISLEIEAHHAEAARNNFERAGIAHKTEVRVGPAGELLDEMILSAEPKFDIAFIDADKEGYVDYLERTLKLVRKGGLILADNTLSQGVLDHTTKQSPIARFNHVLASNTALTSTIVPMVRDDIDGLSVSVVN
jgi:predicted O-methyltransferase YrrM